MVLPWDPPGLRLPALCTSEEPQELGSGWVLGAAAALWGALSQSLLLARACFWGWDFLPPSSAPSPQGLRHVPEAAEPQCALGYCGHRLVHGNRGLGESSWERLQKHLAQWDTHARVVPNLPVKPRRA